MFVLCILQGPCSTQLDLQVLLNPPRTRPGFFSGNCVSTNIHQFANQKIGRFPHFFKAAKDGWQVGTTTLCPWGVYTGVVGEIGIGYVWRFFEPLTFEEIGWSDFIFLPPPKKVEALERFRIIKRPWSELARVSCCWAQHFGCDWSLPLWNYLTLNCHTFIHVHTFKVASINNSVCLFVGIGGSPNERVKLKHCEWHCWSCHGCARQRFVRPKIGVADVSVQETGCWRTVKTRWTEGMNQKSWIVLKILEFIEHSAKTSIINWTE